MAYRAGSRGPQGLREMAVHNFDKAHYAYERLCRVPWL
mgnify:CR=1 FL=1